MRRRALLSATAAALTTPLVAGCSRDDGGGGGDGDSGDGDGGGGGPYGMISADSTVLAAGRTRGGRRGPALGPEPDDDG